VVAVKPLREPKRQQGSGKTGLSGWISVRISQKYWLVRAKLCQTILWKLDCENEALSDYFVKVKFCQFELWKLYCINKVLTGKSILVFMLKLLNFGRNYCFCNLLLRSEFSEKVFSLRRWRFYLLPLSTSACRIESEQCSFLCRRGRATLGWGHSSSQHARIL